MSIRDTVAAKGRGKAWGDPGVPVNVIEVSPDNWQKILDLVEAHDTEFLRIENFDNSWWLDPEGKVTDARAALEEKT